MGIRSSVYGLPDKGIVKNASFWNSLVPSLGDITRGITDLGALGAVYLIAASAAAGTGAGWLASKLTEHQDRDVATARKSYENERLKADIGYLKSRVEQEYDAQQRKQAPKAARVIG